MVKTRECMVKMVAGAAICGAVMIAVYCTPLEMSTLTVNRDPTAGGTVTVNGFITSGTTSHSSGSSVTVVAFAAAGYTFTGWSGASASMNSSICITMSSDLTLTANFQLRDDIAYGELTDSRDGQKYRTVVIGSQTWMAENLNYNASGSWCYGNNPSYCDTYGRLYEWNTAMAGAASSSANPSGVQGVCPVGWHLPSVAEWTALTDAVGGASTADTKLKSQTGWYIGLGYIAGTDDFGFSALPGGGRWDNSFHYVGLNGYWWTATQYDASRAYYRDMSYGRQYVIQDYNRNEVNGFSLRCLLDVR